MWHFQIRIFLHIFHKNKYNFAHATFYAESNEHQTDLLMLKLTDLLSLKVSF